MKALLLSSALIVAGMTQAFPLNQLPTDTENMTCAQVQAYMAQNGAAKLSTGGGIYASFRSEYCPAEVPAYVCTQDISECHIGTYCGWNFSAVNPQHYKQGTESCHAKG